MIGESRWNFTTGGGIMSSPALSPNGHFVYIGSYVLSLFPSATAAALLLLLLLLSSPVGIVLWRL